ncbi:MAG: type I methionyl aminopeptidase [Candidatus Omnitrophota bacterium]|jgi:methionyl aminopeptidase
MVILKTPHEIELMRLAGKILKRIVDKLKIFVAPDKTTQEIDDYAAGLIAQEGLTAAFKGYRGFPANICVSINEEVVHGIPSGKRIKSGDIVSLDMGLSYQGYFADTAVTLPVGKIKPSVKKLLQATKQALSKGIQQARVGNHLGDISYSIQRHVEANGFSVVRQFVGHGIGCKLQEEPEVPNFGKPHDGEVLKAGMVLAIEPMVNMGNWEVEILGDGWTVVTKDKMPSAHFEHTVAITENGPEILT